MFAPVFDKMTASTDVTDKVGGVTNPRIYSFGEVVGQPVDRPYIVFQNVSGSPYNKLHDTPDKDSATVQIDVYATEANECRQLAMAARDALEGDCYMVSGPRENKEQDTKLFRISMDFDWIINHNEV